MPILLVLVLVAVGVGAYVALSGDVPDELAAEPPTEVLSTTVDSQTETEATVSLEYRTQGGSTETEQVHLLNGDDGWRVDIDVEGDCETLYV